MNKSIFPDQVVKLVSEIKNMISNYFIKRAYIRSFKKAGKDTEVMNIAEEGMEDYLNQIKSLKA